MIVTVTSYGPREWLCARGFSAEGEVYIRSRRGSTIAAIQAAVASWYGIPVYEMRSPRRSREVARPRQLAMYIARKTTPLSTIIIGQRFGWRDHSTVIHAVQRIEELRKTDPDLDSDIKALTRELEG